MPASAASLPEPVAPEDSGDAEFLRVLRTCDPGAALDGPLTFAPGPAGTGETWLRAWRQWRDQVFEPVLAPILAAVAVQAQQGHAREMLALDAGLKARLEPAAAARCQAAGRRLLQSLRPARGDRWVAKLADAVARTDAPAHFPIVYAGQSAFFHLPLRLLLPTYAYWEWSAALAGCAITGVLPDFVATAAEWQRLADGLLAPSPFHAADSLPHAGRIH